MLKKNINYVKAILAILIFSYVDLLTVIVLKKCFNMTIVKTDIKLLVLLDFICSFIVMFLLVLVYKSDLINEIKKTIKDIKENKISKFIGTLFEAYAISLVFKIGSALVAGIILQILGLEPSVANNQEIINEMFKISPALIFISACVFAPVEEEILFRLMPSKILKNKWVFIIVSGLIFGLRHVTSSITLLSEIFIIGIIIDYLISHKEKRRLGVIVLCLIFIMYLGIYSFQYGNLLLKIKSFDINEVVNSIIYVSMGISFGYIYKKYNNIYINMGVHALNNTIGMLALFFK